MREVGLVDGAALTNILDDDEAGLALALLVDKHLVGAAGVDSFAPLSNRIIGITFRTPAAKSIDAIEVPLAIAVERVKVEHLIPAAHIAVVIGAGGDLGGRLAVFTVLGCDRDDQQEK